MVSREDQKIDISYLLLCILRIIRGLNIIESNVLIRKHNKIDYIIFFNEIIGLKKNFELLKILFITQIWFRVWK